MNDSTGSSGSFWSRLSPLYKKRFFQGVVAYALVFALVGGWLFSRADTTREEWQARIPHVVAPVADMDTTTAQITTPDIADPPPYIPPQARISLIVTEAGLNDSLTQQALNELPPTIAIAFSAYSPRLKEWIAAANKDGHDSLLLLPMEPLNYPKNDPGPRALLSRQSTAENAAKLASLLRDSTGIKGTINFMGSRFLNDRDNLMRAFSNLADKDIFFIETPSQAYLSAAAAMAKAADMTYGAADVHIETLGADKENRQALFQLEKIALEKGHAIGLIALYPNTLPLLTRWTDGLARRGIELVSPSGLIKDTPAHDTTHSGTAP